MTSYTALKGHIIFTPEPDRFEIHERSWLLARDGIIQGISRDLPESHAAVAADFGDCLIIPGFCDLHLHAAQFLQTGMGMTHTLLDWLKDYTFDLEERFKDEKFAREAYGKFAQSLARAGTLNACIFASSDTRGTELLCQALEKTGIKALVGKVNMDRNAPDSLIETPEQSIAGTCRLVDRYGDHPRIRPVITPRFAPTCSDALLGALGKLAAEKSLPVQSHLGETSGEIQWVKKLFPDDPAYAHVYHRHGLFGQTPTAMAHGIYLLESEIDLVRANGVFLVHCPDSNINVRSGIMPVRKYLEAGLTLGLGSDIAGGHKIGLNEAIVRAVQLSKLLSLEDEDARPLSICESFYLATKGGGQFFGRTGSLEPGFDLDALVIEDDPLLAEIYTVEDRLEKFLYTGDDRNIIARYVQGNAIDPNI